ncbi:hypothetical protein FRC12_010658 [Ceratobasidium sp. 428]|nr:hypothetical protein FRC12_010658 [Ceratobasidium sp. 428]
MGAVRTKKHRTTAQILALNRARCERLEPSSEQANEIARCIRVKESKSYKKLMAERDKLAAQNLRLRAQKHNALKSIRRAKRKSIQLAQEKKKLAKQLGSMTAQTKKQHAAQDGQNRRYKTKMERYRKSKLSWKQRAYAAEEARRYMLSKKSKTLRTPAVFKTKIHNTYNIRIRSLSRKLIMSGVSAVQVPKVIRTCAQSFGVSIGQLPSPRSVGRFILEGGVGAAIQAGDILANAQGMLFSRVKL